MGWWRLVANGGQKLLVIRTLSIVVFHGYWGGPAFLAVLTVSFHDYHSLPMVKPLCGGADPKTKHRICDPKDPCNVITGADPNLRMTT